jgi:spore germination protein GerM
MAARRRSRTRSRGAPGRGSGAAILFWLCLAAIAVAVIIAARQPVADALRRLQDKPPAAQQPQVTVTPLPETPAAPTPSGSEGATPPAAAPSGTPSASSAASGATSADGEMSNPAPAAVEKPVARKARLYFATVDDNGMISMKSVVRSIPASDSPLRDTLQTLLAGPTAQELNLGLVSMIPSGAVLRGVVVRGDMALVDFSEGFRFNAQGVDAMTTQLRQIVYAATEFPNVARVQILIEGKKVTYLGTEGVRIDAPLSRASFQR